MIQYNIICMYICIHVCLLAALGLVSNLGHGAWDLGLRVDGPSRFSPWGVCSGHLHIFRRRLLCYDNCLLLLVIITITNTILVIVTTTIIIIITKYSYYYYY